MAEIREKISHKEICELGIPHSSFNCGRVRNSRSDRSLENVDPDLFQAEKPEVVYNSTERPKSVLCSIVHGLQQKADLI
jgi:hypothetical protein